VFVVVDNGKVPASNYRTLKQRVVDQASGFEHGVGCLTFPGARCLRPKMSEERSGMPSAHSPAIFAVFVGSSKARASRLRWSAVS
jgi:hypothetical protein